MTFLPLIDATYFLLSNALDMDEAHVLSPDNQPGISSGLSSASQKSTQG